MYLVLKKDKEGWVEYVGPVEAASQRQAIDGAIHASVPIGTEGEYVAVPARSWQPVKVQVETALKFS